MVSPKGKKFYAEATKGYILKVMIDALATSISKAIFEINEDGFFHKGTDESGHILFDINFPSENFKSYTCKENLKFSLNLKHLRNEIRTIKKKDSVIMFIDEKTSDKFSISIVNKTSNVPRTETVNISILNMTDEEVVDPPDSSAYKNPMVIDASGFQKTKKIATSINKIVAVEIQGNNYISFAVNKNVIDTKTEFGEIDEDEDAPEIYSEEFFITTFSPLLKLPGLCTQMQFFAPSIRKYPMKVSMLAGTLGKISVFIKDSHQIAFEESKKHQL